MHRASDANPSAHGNGGGPNRPAASATPAPPPPTPLDSVVDGHVCPFCGLVRDITEEFDATAPCPRCTLADTPTTRNATKARIGPWHVRQMRNPWAPGMRWETLLALIKRGQVTRDSVVRGPTTHQLWKRASEVKGLSREFGVCYSCGADLDAAANLCGHCNRLQEPPANPNVLVETRELGAGQNGGGGGGGGGGAAESSKPSSRGSAKSTRRGHRGDDIDDSAHAMDVGASTPHVGDPDDMLSVDDAESTAAFARSVTSRGPQQQRGGRSPSDAASGSSSSKREQQKKQQSRPEPADETPPAPAPRPMTLRPRQPGADDALLTPQELAAAFQLNFAPPPGTPGAGAATGLRGNAAGAAAVDRPRPPRRKRSKRSLFFGLFLLALAAVAPGVGVALAGALLAATAGAGAVGQLKGALERRQLAVLGPWAAPVTTEGRAVTVDAPAERVWVVGGLRLYHRDGCRALAGRAAGALARQELAADARPCGLCEPDGR
jgi:hypothetical protein